MSVSTNQLLIGQVLIVFAIILAGLVVATQWTAMALGFQPRLGPPWFTMGMPVYNPWRLFQWWYAYEAYAPAVFNRGGLIAAFGSGPNSVSRALCRIVILLEARLDRTRVMAVVGELVASRMPEHVRMDREGELRELAGARQ